MKSALQELIDEEVEEAKESTIRQVAIASLRTGIPPEKVVYITNLPLEEIMSLSDVVNSEK